MLFSTAIAAAILVLTCSSAPTLNRLVVHEKRDGNLHQWEKRSRAAPHYVLPIKIGLRQRNLENAEKYIYDIADPSSPNFGK
jgi:tripeptidyl-peptidase-1